MKKHIIYSYILILILIISFRGYADENGIWHKAEDIRGGIFGEDEQDVTTNYKFINNVYFDKNIFIKNDLMIYGNVNIANQTILGKYTLSSIPTCNNLNYGSLIFNLDKKKPYVCSNDGNKWKPLDSDFDEDGIVDWQDLDDENKSLLSINLTPSNIKYNISIFGIKGNLTEGPSIECESGFLGSEDCKVTTDFQFLSSKMCGTQTKDCYLEATYDHYIFRKTTKDRASGLFTLINEILTKKTSCSGNSGYTILGPTSGMIVGSYKYTIDFNNQKEFDKCQTFCGIYGADIWTIWLYGVGSSKCQCGFTTLGHSLTSADSSGFRGGYCY